MNIVIVILLFIAPIISSAQPRIAVRPESFRFTVPGPVVRDGARVTITNQGNELLEWQSEIEIIQEPENGSPPRDDEGDLLATFQWNRVGDNNLKPGIALEPGSGHLILSSNDPPYLAILEHDDSYQFLRVLNEWELNAAPLSIACLNNIIYVVTAGNNYLKRYDLEGNELERLNLQFIPLSITCNQEENWLILLAAQRNHLNFLDEQGEQFGWVSRGIQNAGAVVWMSEYDGSLWISNGTVIFASELDLPNHNLQTFLQFRIPNVQEPNLFDGMGHDGRSLVVGSFDQEGYMVVDDGFRNYRWLRIVPLSGQIEPDSSQVVQVIFNFEDLVDGDYEAGMIFMSNDPDNEVEYVTIEIHLTGGPEVEAKWPVSAGYPARVNFVSLYPHGIFPDDTCRALVEIWNLGSETLVVRNIRIEGQGYFCAGDSAMIRSGMSLPLEIIFSMDDIGSYDGRLNFDSNDDSEQEVSIILRATVSDPPVITTDPQSLSLNMPAPGDSLRLRITDRGGFRLEWEAEFHWLGGDSLPDSLVHLRDNWVTIRPDSGTIFTRETRSLYLRFGEINQHSPEERGELVIRSNDPANPEIAVPLILTWLGVETDTPEQPLQTELSGFYPNPFNSRTTAVFTLGYSGQISVLLFDQSGREVASIARGELGQGRHRLNFDAQDIPAGIYFAILKTSEVTLAKKVVVVR